MSAQVPWRRLPSSRNVRPPSLLLLDQLVRAAVPDLDGPGAVLALGDLALEGRVLERMVFDVNSEVLLAGLERHAFRHGPARERAVALEAKVVVERPRLVTLDDEDRRALSGARPPGRGRAVFGSGVFPGVRLRR